MIHKMTMLLRGLAVAGIAASTAASGADWPAGGNDLKNSRYQESETQISPKTARNLTLKWALETSGDVTANPAVDGGHLYFPD